MVGVISVRPFRIQNDVVRPDEAPVSAKDIEVRLTASRNVVFRHDKTNGGVTRWPGPQLERDLIRGARPANRSQVFGERFDVFLLAKGACSRCFARDGPFSSHSADDLNPPFLCTPPSSCKLQR